jgi:hypothetical protein
LGATERLGHPRMGEIERTHQSGGVSEQPQTAGAI